MFNCNEVDTVYLAYGIIDLRKSIDGLVVKEGIKEATIKNVRVYISN